MRRYTRRVAPWSGRAQRNAITWAGFASLLAANCNPHSGVLSERADDGQLTATSQATDGTGTMHIHDAGAPYPSSASPLTWSEQHNLFASDGGAWHFFGTSTALDGDTALVGATGNAPAGSNSGVAYVFVRNAATWTQEQRLLPSDGTANARFGFSVAVSGDTALIGADGDDDGGGASGSVYVYVRSAATWSEQQKLVASDAGTEDYFGGKTALNGDLALIGADGDDNGNGIDAGAFYVFMRSASTWSEQQKLIASDGAAGDRFGTVAMSADTALVGSRYNDAASTRDGGSVYAFVRSASTWSEQQKLIASDGGEDNFFGAAIAMHGDTALVGASGNSSAGSNSGAAYAFVRSASTWSEQQKLIASDGAAGDRFGSVALGSNISVVGAPGDNDAGTDSGSAYAFARIASTWTEQQKLTPGDAGNGDFFGSSVAMSGDTALVAAKSDGDAGTRAGSAYVFALRLVDGQPCTDDAGCVSNACVHGYCCDNTCDSPCERCDASGLEGICTPAARGDTPSPSCNGYACNGAANNCPTVCAANADCTTTHYCQDAVACIPKADNGQTCTGNSACLSGHCVGGICCTEACNEGCGSCVATGSEGLCTPLDAGHPGTPSCTPYLCTGGQTGCPSQCTVPRDCANGYHCESGACLPATEQGGACNEDGTCISGHCTDEVCCVVATCGAYRCGAVGACEASCSSSAQCAPGNECNSGGKCVPLADTTAESGGCHLANPGAPNPRPSPWPAALGLLALFGLARKRR